MPWAALLLGVFESTALLFRFEVGFLFGVIPLGLGSLVFLSGVSGESVRLMSVTFLGCGLSLSILRGDTDRSSTFSFFKLYSNAYQTERRFRMVAEFTIE